MSTLGAIVWDANPIIFNLFGTFPVGYYGLLFALGFFVAYYVMNWVFKREDIPGEYLDQLTIYLILGTVIGARLGHFLFYQPEYFWKAPLEIILPIAKVNGSYEFVGFRGLASHGAAIGVLIALILFVRRTKVNFLWLLDRIAIVIPIPCGFIRLGNFMNSEIIGRPTGSDYGVIFTLVDDVARHPAQLYEAFAYFAGFLILLFVYAKYNKPAGFNFGLLLIILFSARFFIEFFKEAQVAFEENMTLNMGQWLSLPFVAIGVIIIVFSFTNVFKALKSGH